MQIVDATPDFLVPCAFDSRIHHDVEVINQGAGWSGALRLGERKRLS
jgi:hypothetical protein